MPWSIPTVMPESFRHDGFFVLRLLLGLALALGASASQAVETLVVGGRSGQSWAATAAAAPVVDFATRPGWMLPSSVDRTTNIALETFARGGGVTSPNAQAVLRLNKDVLAQRLGNMVDGDDETAFEAKNVVATGILLVMDLGARFGVDHIRFFPRPAFRADFMKGYVLSINDGVFGAEIVAATPDKLPNKSLFTIIAQDGSNNRDTVDVRFPLQYVRYIRLESTQRFNWEIDEIEIFGRGFVPEAAYLSRVLDLREPAILGNLHWSAEQIGQPEKSRIVLRTRSGETASPEERPEGWSAWSPPYKSSGTSILSPSPRRYVQFSVDFESDGLEAATSVDSLVFAFSRPALAERIVGEIWPQEVPVGVSANFVYSVQVVGGRGFDRLEIDTPAPVEAIHSLRLDGEEAAYAGTVGERGLSVDFARQSGDHTLQVAFSTVVLRYETVFSGRLRNTGADELPQEIVAGDATDSLAGDDLSVRVPLGGDELLHRVSVMPNPFTPNGDQVNDQTTLSYDLLHLTGEVPVALWIYDLAGRRLVEVSAQSRSSGRHLHRWDGRDSRGELLPPGLYIAQVEVDTDSGTERRSSIVAIAY